jgi:DNA polymerase-3 subunit alpha
MADGMPGMAITDHANMFGIVEFVECVNRKNAEKNTNFKPIIGCEFYVARRGMEHKSEREDFAGYHLVLLAKNYTGYRNLIKLVSRSWTEGFCGRPRTDKADLERYHEGLICTSACIGGEVAQHIINDRLAEAEASALWYKNLFGEDFYLELQRHKPTAKVSGREIYKLEKKSNKELCRLSKKLGIKLICANDAHFVNEEDAELQDTLLCVNWKKKYDDSTRLVFSKQEWLKTTAEMIELFADIPEALDNTVEILNKVENFSIFHNPILPKVALPEGVDEVEYLARLTFEGAHKRFGEVLPAEVKARLKSELKEINNHSVPAYFLLWYEIVTAALELGAVFDFGRSSTACSLVAFCLGLTEINPLEWNLPFERFLVTEERLLPKISIELDSYGRERIVAWLKERFGADCVSNVVAFNSIARCSAHEIVESVYSNFSEQQKTSFLPLCERLEGVKRGASLHSCSVAICGEPIAERVPMAVFSDSVTGEPTLATQYGGHLLETTGILKLDILSNNFLDVIKYTMKNLLYDRGVVVDISNIPVDDKKSFELLGKGKTLGVFQFEGKEMQNLLKTAQPNTFKELVEIFSSVCPAKAHAISVAWIAFQTAYLKAHYPAEYIEALLYTFRHIKDKYKRYLESMREKGL